MGINTLVKDGIIYKLNYPVTVWDLDEDRWHHNPSICRDPSGKIWVSTRHHEEKPAVRYANPLPYSHPTSWLMVGILDETTLKPSKVKRIKPHKSCPIYIQEKEIEDVRIFWRKDGLHGIGAAINAHTHAGETRVYQVEILIDYEAGTYKLLKDWDYIVGHMEKNWSPPTIPTDAFDYIYSPIEIVKGDQVIGEAHYDGKTHGGSQVLPYKDGWIRIAHQVINIPGITHRWYASLAQLINKQGLVTHDSQFFDFCTGWRPQIRESVEFVSGAVWSKGKENEELLISYGLRDETCAFTRMPVDILKWEPLEDVVYYNWRFDDNKPPTDPENWIGGKFAGSVSI